MPRLPALAAALLLAPLAAAETPLHRQIDEYLDAGWKKDKTTVAGPAADARFLRRVYLDLVGAIPTADEAKKFLADKDAKKRDKLIDNLIADPRFAARQAEVWDLVLFGRNPPNFDVARKRDAFRAWLAKQFKDNVGYDR